MSASPGISELYLATQRAFVELARTLDDADWGAPVPCCPGWTVRDVLSHVAGLSDDVLAGRIEGAATDPWTASQVERYRDRSVDDLLAQWDEQTPTLAAALEQFGESRPPFDCCTHEHDVRGAIGRPGNRDSVMIGVAANALRGSAPVPVPHGLDDFEVFRSRLGRRSAAQVLAYDWTDPPSPAQLDEWFTLGPSPVDIDE